MRKIDPGGRFRIRAALALGALGYLAAVCGASAQTPAPKTVKDKIYSKAQADKGEAQYGKVCAQCHDPAKLPAGKKAAPPLVGDKFLDKWTDKTVGELLTLIATTMPDDGSVVLTDADAAALVAYILKANGFPDGPKDLDAEKSKDVVIK